MKKSELAAKRATELYQEKIASLENKENSDLDVDGARASLQLARAAADKAEYDLERVKITAPFEGVITQRYVDIGGWVEKGDPIFEMVNIGRVEVIAEIPERQISTTTNATNAQIVFDAFPDKIVSGKIAAIAPKANSKTRTFPVRIVIDNPDYKIKAGMFARVRIPTTERKKAVLIPRDAVVWRFRKALVFRADSKGVVSSAIVRLGRQYGEMVEAQGDVKPGMKLIVTGNEILRDGQIVRVVGEKKL
jgi:RND family efflux transporter MFP subunit